MKSVFQNTYPSATWYSDCVKEVDGKNIGVLELLTPALDTEIYNLIYVIKLDGKLLLCSFNATEEQMEDWKPIAKEIMNSMEFE